jgi:hypothetical protein
MENLMFGMNPPAPKLCTPPADPCLKCLSGEEHESDAPGLVVCDPIMAAMGLWTRRQERLRKMEIEDLIAEARQRLA